MEAYLKNIENGFIPTGSSSVVTYIDATISVKCLSEESLNNIMAYLRNVDARTGLPISPPSPLPSEVKKRLELKNKQEIEIDTLSNSIDSLEL